NFVPTNTTTPSSTGYKGTRYVNPEDANALTNYRYKKTDWSYLTAAPTPLINKGDLFTYKSNEEQTEFAGQGNEEEPYKASFGTGAKAITLSGVKGAWDWIGNTLAHWAFREENRTEDEKKRFSPILGRELTEDQYEVATEATAKLREEDPDNVKWDFIDSVGSVINPVSESIYQEHQNVSKAVNPFFRDVSGKIAKEAELEKQPGWVQFAGHLVESTPYTVASLLPAGTGMILNYGAMYTASYNQKLAEKEARGEPITEEDKDNIETYAAGAALVEAASEQIFRIGALKVAGKAGAKVTAQALKTMPMKNAIAYIAKYWVKNGLEEGAEEVISEIGQGAVAKFTTDKDAPWWDESNPDSILTAKNIGLAGLGGFIMGATLTTLNTKSAYNEFKNSKQMYEEVKDMPLEALTADIQARGKEAVLKDLLSRPNRRVAQTEIMNEIARADEISSIGDQIERYENIDISLSNLVSTATTPQEQAIYKEAKQRVQNSLNEARKAKVEMKRTGSPYTPQQIESMLTSAKNNIAEDNNALRETTSNEIRVALQEDIAFFQAQISELELYKGSFAPEFAGKDISMETKKQARGLPKAVKKTRAYEYGAFETAPSQYTIMRKSLTKPSSRWQALPATDSRSRTYDSIQAASGALYAPSTPAKVAAMEEQSAEPAAAKERMTYEQAQLEQSKALSKESMKANPPAGIEHIVSPESRGLFDMSQSEQNREDFAYKKTQSEETIRRIEEASTPAKDPRLFRNKVKEFFDNSEYRAEVINRAKVGLTFGSVRLNRKYGDILRTWRTLRKSNGLASAEALKIVETIYKQVPKGKQDLFNSALIYADMVEDIK
ncbi:MAG: hypothetical protein WC910_11720, partial [Bacteroidales bacterium]